MEKPIRFPKPQKAAYPAVIDKGERQPSGPMKDKPDELRNTGGFGLHTIKAPIGKYIYVGSVPAELDGKHFDSEAEAVDYANNRGWHCGKPIKIDEPESPSKRGKPKDKPTGVSSSSVKLTIEDIETTQGKRTERARKMDAARTNKNVRTIDNAGPWLKNPARYDLEGVDTPGRKGAHSGILRIDSNSGSVIKKGRARGRARKSRSVMGMKIIKRR